MKCPSVVSIWPSDSPISQKITATAVLKNPPTLYTGGGDGSIIWWNVLESDSDQVKYIPSALKLFIAFSFYQVVRSCNLFGILNFPTEEKRVFLMFTGNQTCGYVMWAFC